MFCLFFALLQLVRAVELYLIDAFQCYNIFRFLLDGFIHHAKRSGANGFGNLIFIHFSNIFHANSSSAQQFL